MSSLEKAGLTMILRQGRILGDGDSDRQDVEEGLRATSARCSTSRLRRRISRFGVFPLGDVEDEGDGRFLAEEGEADQHGNAGAVLADVLLLVGDGRAVAGRGLGDGPFVVREPSGGVTAAQPIRPASNSSRV